MPKDKGREKRADRKVGPYEKRHKGNRGDRRRKHHGGDDTAPVSTFDEMNLKADLLKGVYAYGFEKPSAIQQRAIRPIVRGRDVIAQSQSGTGKTAVFSISALQLLDETSRDTQVLVLSPTRELAEQSQRVLQSLGDFMNVRKELVGLDNSTLRFGSHQTVSTGKLSRLYWREIFGKRFERAGAGWCPSGFWHTRSSL